MVKEKQKLVWLGVKRPSQTQSNAEGEIEKLRNEVGNYSTFQNDLDDENISSFSDLETYLIDNNFSQQESNSFIEKIKNSFEDSDGDSDKYDDFEDFVENESSSYSELKSKFNSQSSFGTELETEDGRQAGGIRTFESSGVTYGGVSVPAGSVEVFGREIHFSQSNAVKSGDGSGSTGGGSIFTVDNFRTDDSNNIETIGSSMTFLADITNNGSYSEYFVAVLSEDGDSIDSVNIHIGAGNTRTVSFTVTKNDYFCGDYMINTAGPITACWTPTGITGI